ncbi:IS5 family transposase [Streptomyces sp. DSM 118878]
MILADAQWARIEPLLPDRTPKRGGRWRDHRQVIDAIAFKYRTGTPWTDLPEHFGSWKGVHNRLRKWAADGTWEKVFTALLAQADSEGDLDWVIAVDSTVVRAHQHAAGARQGALADEPDHHALGRSCGGLTTKIHLAADGRCRPLAFVLTPGQAGDAPAFPQLGTLRASGALASWMFRIVRNECLRRARARLRDHGAPLREDTPVASAEDEVLQRMDAGRVAAAVAALPPDQRRVLIMRDIQGHSGRMVADALGLSTAAMKSRLHRARAAVQRSLRTAPGSASASAAGSAPASASGGHDD